MMRVCIFESFLDLHKNKCQIQAGVERQEHQTGMQANAHARVFTRLPNMDTYCRSLKALSSMIMLGFTLFLRF